MISFLHQFQQRLKADIVGDPNLTQPRSVAAAMPSSGARLSGPLAFPCTITTRSKPNASRGSIVATFVTAHLYLSLFLRIGGKVYFFHSVSSSQPSSMSRTDVSGVTFAGT